MVPSAPSHPQLSLSIPNRGLYPFFPKHEIEQSIPQRFAQQVQRHGERTAVLCEAGALTYAELDRASNQVASALRGLGHESGSCVAFLAEQGLVQIVAIFGVLKAGGIYVPLDPSLSRARWGEILDDSQAGVVLTDRVNEAAARLVAGAGRQVLNIAGDDLAAPSSAAAPALPVAPEAYACIYYTSGSTGRAKGVVDDHRNVLHNVARYTNHLGVTSDDRLTLLQSCGFSGAVSNIFTALLNGATLLPFDVRARGVTALAQWLALQRPTIYHSVPALFRQVMGCGIALPSLRFVRLEGDASRAIDVGVFNRHFDARCTLVNGLGATETGISAQCFIEHGAPLPEAAVPVGHATDDMRIDVCDAAGQPVAPGALGEVVVTSAYLARGYWRRPELTAAAFTAVNGGLRAYRTRDLGRFDAAGRLVCHGRIDLLAKVRGEWVDLGALEQALARCPGVRDAVAMVSDGEAGDAQLVGFFIADAATAPAPHDLREMLRGAGLAPHAVPSRFVRLERWPLDRNGKVDRRALLAVPTESSSSSAAAAPLRGTERIVAAAFERVLGVAVAGASDDFFELGGDSLKAVDVCAELARHTGSELALGVFQHAASVGALARLLDGAVSPGCLVPLQPHGSQRALFCVHAHRGHVFNLRELARQFEPEVPFFGLPARGLDGVEPPAASIEAMADDYLGRVREAQPRGPYRLAGYCFGAWVALEMARRMIQRGEHVDVLFLIAPGLPPGFAGAPPLGQRWTSRWQRLRREPWRSVASWLRRRFEAQSLPQPARSIDAMARRYRPAPFAGDAVVLIPRGELCDDATRRAWQAFIRGQVRFEVLAGDSTDVLRPPWVRDLAARMLAALGSRSG
jgi:amino acid adenylation domain-containing protein